jgi:esterase
MPIELFFRKTGQGPFLVILHGFLGSSDNWVSFARKLEEHHTVIIPDLRNHGRSPHTTTHTYEDMAEDLNRLFEANGIGKAVILGHSMGGKAAMMFGAWYPEKVSHLIVADVAPKIYPNGTNFIQSGEATKTIINLIDRLDLQKFSTRREIEETLAINLKDAGMRQLILKNIFRDSEGQFRWKINIPVLRDSFDSVLYEVNEEWFGSLKPVLNYPVTFIRGLNSYYITDQDIPVIKTIYPEAIILDIPGAGHWLHIEQPDLFLKALTESIHLQY